MRVIYLIAKQYIYACYILKDDDFDIHFVIYFTTCKSRVQMIKWSVKITSHTQLQNKYNTFMSMSMSSCVSPSLSSSSGSITQKHY